MNLDEMTKSEVLEYVNNANTGFIKLIMIKKVQPWKLILLKIL